MARPSSLKVLFVFLSIVNATVGLGIDFLTEDEASENFDTYANRLQLPGIFGGEDDSLFSQGRILLPIFLGSGGLNLTVLAALAAIAAATLLPLLGIAALGLLLWAVLSQHMSGYGHTGYSSYASSYRSFDLAETDWESLSILDWIKVAEDTYNKYEPTNLECQKKVICELYQHSEQLGQPAQVFMNIFNYLNYVEVFSFPDNIKDVVEELVDAAERGKSLKRDCEDIFSDCLFSVKKIVQKYGHGRSLDIETNKI